MSPDWIFNEFKGLLLIFFKCGNRIVVTFLKQSLSSKEGVLVKLAPYAEGKEEKGRLLHIGRWQFYKQACLGWLQRQVALYPNPQNLENLYTKALMGFSPYSVQMVSTTHCSLKAVSLKMAPSVGPVGRTQLTRTGKGLGRL